MLKTYRGSCHCGAVRFEAEIDLQAGTSRCNCSICTKRRAWNVVIKPDAFRLLGGQETLGDYSFGTGQGHQHFCSKCGCAPFSRGEVAELGGPIVAVNLGSLDDASDEELASAPISYGDGRNNAWWQSPAVTAHL